MNALRMIAKVVLLTTVILWPEIAGAGELTPRFRDYPATAAFKGRNAPLVMSREDRMYRKRLREAAREKPNFAAHYILTVWGCGTECVDGAIIDAGTGKVYWLPHTVCCWGSRVKDDFKPIKFRLDSRLIVFSGARNEKDGDNGTHFYEFKKGRFVHIRSVMKEKAH